MATCRFCGNEFRNAQAVRAHLKGCEAYHGARRPRAARGGRAPASRGSLPKAMPKAREPQATGIESAEPAWTLRHVEEGRGRPPEPAEGERELARHRAAQEAKERQRREQADQERHRRRRELIQRAKSSTGRAWRLKWGFTLTPEVEARVMQAIERELAAAPVNELPWSEVQTIAEGVWERVCTPAEAEQREANRRADEAAAQQQQAREAAAQTVRVEQERTLAQWRREADERAQRTARTRELTAHGQAYLEQALAEVGDLSPTERIALTWKVERALAARVASAGTQDDVEDLVDDMLKREGDIVVEDEEADEVEDDDWDDHQDEDEDEDEYDDEEE